MSEVCLRACDCSPLSIVSGPSPDELRVELIAERKLCSDPESAMAEALSPTTARVIARTVASHLFLPSMETDIDHSA
jgi:hypothetical protein